MKKRALKSLLFEQVSRLGKALSSPRRLEILELLAQAEKSVEALAGELAIDVKLTSAHLKVLKEARLLAWRREGKNVIYRLAGADVATLWVTLRQVAEQHLLELQKTLERMAGDPASLRRLDRDALLAGARSGDIIVIDVRPVAEYETAHLPFARSMPLAEIEQRLAELPAGKEVVAYCRGPFCLMSNQAVALLQHHGFQVRKLDDGVAEWVAAGLPVEEGQDRHGRSVRTIRSARRA